MPMGTVITSLPRNSLVLGITNCFAALELLFDQSTFLVQRGPTIFTTQISTSRTALSTRESQPWRSLSSLSSDSVYYTSNKPFDTSDANPEKFPKFNIFSATLCCASVTTVARSISGLMLSTSVAASCNWKLIF